MPVVSLASLSDEPPLVGFASSPSHSTYVAIIEAGRFSVSWLDTDHAKAVIRLGTETGLRKRDKLGDVGLHHRRGRALGVPLIDEASATLECRLESSKKVGDHRLVVGRVERAEAIEDFCDYWAFDEYRPILYEGLERPVGSLAPPRSVTRPSSTAR